VRLACQMSAPIRKRHPSSPSRALLEVKVQRLQAGTAGYARIAKAKKLHRGLGILRRSKLDRFSVKLHVAQIVETRPGYRCLVVSFQNGRSHRWRAAGFRQRYRRNGYRFGGLPPTCNHEELVLGQLVLGQADITWHARCFAPLRLLV